MVAAELAANSPRRVSRLVLLSAIGLWRDDTPIPDIAGTSPARLPELLLAIRRAASNSAWGSSAGG